MRKCNPMRQKGFTFAETLITIVIISILASALMLIFGPASDSAKRAKCSALRKQTELASQLYLFEQHSTSESFQALVDAGHLERLPACPSGGEIYWAAANEGSSFRRVECTVHTGGEAQGEPLTPYGSTFEDIAGGLIKLVEAYHAGTGHYPRSWGDYAFTDLGLDRDFWADAKDHIIYSTGGDKLKIEPEDGYTLRVVSATGETWDLASTLNWNLWYNFDDKTWYYHTTDPGNEIDITTLQVIKTE